MLPDYLRGEKKMIIPSHDPANSFQRWFCQIIRTQTEEAFIIVIYDTLPKTTAPGSSGRANTKWLWKQYGGSRTRPSSTHSHKPKPDRGWEQFQIKMGLGSCESSKKIFCYRIVNQVIMSPVSLPPLTTGIDHIALWLKSKYKKDYHPPIPQGILQKWTMQSVRGLYLKYLLPSCNCISSPGRG